MKNVALIYSDNFKKLDFGSGHPMRNGKLSNALAAQTKVISADRSTTNYAFILSSDLRRSFGSRLWRARKGKNK